MLRVSGQQPIELIDSWTQTDASGDYTIDFSGKTFQAGDLCVVVLCTWSADTHTLSGFTKTHNTQYDGEDFYCIFERVLDGTETTKASSGGGTLLATSINVMVFRNTSAITGLVDTSYVTASNPNPPSISNVEEDDWVIACGASGTKNYTATAPTNYTLIEEAGVTSGSGNTTTMTAYRTGVSGTVDPGAFGGGTTSLYVCQSTFRLVPS